MQINSVGQTPSFKGSARLVKLLIDAKPRKSSEAERFEELSWAAKKLVKPITMLMNTNLNHKLSEKLGSWKNPVSHLSAMVSGVISAFYIIQAAATDKLEKARKHYLIVNSALGGVMGVGLSYLIDFSFNNGVDVVNKKRQEIFAPIFDDLDVDFSEISKKLGIKTQALFSYFGYNLENHKDGEKLSFKELTKNFDEKQLKEFLDLVAEYVNKQGSATRSLKSLAIFTPVVRLIAPLAAIPLASYVTNAIYPEDKKRPKTSTLRPAISHQEWLNLTSRKK